jgi:hypothetical protein
LIHSFTGNAVDKRPLSERNALSASEFWFIAQAVSDLRLYRHAAVTLDTPAIRKFEGVDAASPSPLETPTGWRL